MNSLTRVKCTLCKENYGSYEKKGLCNMCFKLSLINPSLIEEPNIVTTEIEKNEDLVVCEIPEETKEERPVQTNFFNCWTCNKKVGHLGFKCNCNYIFCGKHRHFSDHNCDFDYKTHDRNKLNTKLLQTQDIKVVK